MSNTLRAFLASDWLVAVAAIVALVCAVLVVSVWRSPQSWHIDGTTKGLQFHAWPQILMAGLGAFGFAILVFLTF